MNFSKKLLFTSLLSSSLLFTACTQHRPNVSTVDTNTTQQVKEEPSAGTSILVTALGYALGFVIGAAIVN
jgi:outer membrane biogenesis lipoprotein LolB